MSYRNLPLIDPTEFETAKREIGPALQRILGYYRQDGVVSITSIEDAMRGQSAASMVIPAHTLKGESRQFGANGVAELALHLETIARRCVEQRVPLPMALLKDVNQLRPLFHATVEALEAALAGPAPAAAARRTARPVFGKRVS